jgi:hypothetical protein
MIIYAFLIWMICLKEYSCQNVDYYMYTGNHINHLESFEFKNSDSSLMNVGEYYNFSFNWNQVQNYTNLYTYSLAEYEMTSVNNFLSYHSLIKSMTTTNGQFSINPYNSNIFKAKFYFILFFPTIDQILVK